MSKKKKQKNEDAAATPALESGAAAKWKLNSPETFALLIAVAVVIWFAFRIGIYAGDTVLFTDECYHAFRSEQMAQLDYPAAPKEVFSGYTDGIPPLFHVFGAADYLIFGRAGFPYLNLFIYLLIAGFTLYFTARYVSPTGAACVALAMFSTDILPQMALRYYQEMLTALVFSITLLFLYYACNRDAWKYSIIAGILLGLFLLTKQTAYTVPPVLLAFWIYFLLKKNWLKVKQFLVLGVIAVALWAPHLYRQYSATGTPFFPFFPPKDFANADFIKLQREDWLKPASMVFDNAVSSIGTLIVILTVAGLLYTLWRWYKKDAGFALVAAVIIASFAIFINSGQIEDRRYLQFVPALCFLGILAIYSSLVKLNYKPAMYIVFIIIGIVAVVKVAGIPNYRLAFNIDPALLKAQKYIRDHTPRDSKIFSVWTYSTFYYSERDATWPQYAPNAPFDLFYVQTAENFMNICSKRGIDYVLVDYARILPPERMSSVGYPSKFYDSLMQLVAERKASEIYPPAEVRAFYEGIVRTKRQLGTQERRTLGEFVNNGYMKVTRDGNYYFPYLVYKIDIQKGGADAAK